MGLEVNGLLVTNKKKKQKIPRFSVTFVPACLPNIFL